MTVEAPTRRDHQIRAISKLTEHYQDGGTRAQIHWACGAGKTLVGRWLAEDLGGQLAVVLLPSLALVAQTLAEWQDAGDWPFTPMVVCSDPGAADSWKVDASWWTDHGVQVTTSTPAVRKFLSGDNAGRPRVIFSTYHSAPIVADAVRRARRTVDLMVCDEAHHLAGRPDARFRLALDNAMFPAHRRLFATATPMLASSAAISMDDKKLFGPVVDKLDFAEAISLGLLVDYEVLVIDAGAGTLTEGQAVPAAVAAAARRGASRMITFHSRVFAARQFANVLDGLTLPDGRAVRARAVAGSDPSTKRRAALTELADTGWPGVTVVPNARCLAEGVDARGVDAVVFADPKASPTDIVQAATRPLRTAPGKTKGLIVIPVVLAAGDDDDEALYSSKYAVVWGVLRALANLDPRMAAEIQRAARISGDDQLTRTGGKNSGGAHPLVTFEIEGLDLSQFAVRLVNTNDGNDEAWAKNLERLRFWADKHGHTAVPSKSTVGRQLGHWVQHQRKAYACGVLPPVRVERLEEIPNWAWTFEGAWWRADIALIHRVAGRWLNLEDPDVAETHLSHRPGKLGTSVGRWAAHQRRAYRGDQLQPWQIADCEQIPGWSWDAGIPERDRKMLDVLAEYVDEHTDVNVPEGTMWAGAPLGSFITAVRRRRVMGNLLLALEYEILAVSPGKFCAGRMDWQPRKATWELNLLALRQYQQREGHLNIPENYTEDFRGWTSNLYDWCVRNRYAYRHGNLDQDKARELEQVPDWRWERSNEPRSASNIGNRSHGTRSGYVAGCRCVPCTHSNQAYRTQVASGERSVDLVDAGPARGHLRMLEGAVGWRSRPAMKALTGLEKKSIEELINGVRARVRPWVNEAVMALTADQLRQYIADNPSEIDPVPASPILRILDDIQARGWPRSWISRELGSSSAGLQIGNSASGVVLRRTADAVRALDERLGRRYLAPGRRRSIPVPPLAEILAASSTEMKIDVERIGDAVAA